MKVTAETITDAQIRGLRAQTGWLDAAAVDHGMFSAALRGDREARERCADAWNARHGGEP